MGKISSIVITESNPLLIRIFSQQSENNASITVNSGYITVDGGKLFYETAGKGENIVLLHDGMVNREIWDEIIKDAIKLFKINTMAYRISV